MARVADGLDDPAEAQSKMVAAFIEQHFTMPNLLIILGHSFTVGSSQNTLPPMVEDCFGSFALRHPRDLKNAIGLTVGAKAWSKHAHRATTGYWGSVKGTTQDKNETAAKLLARIFSEAVWFNIHALPHNIRVYEIRTLQGYGARWYLTEEPLPPADDPEPGTDPDPDAAAPDRIDAPAKARPESLGAKLRISGTMAIEFRGFLEPFMENGHEVGWVH
ncbi:uncharacterized protein BJ171DRAFT_513383 [Polychytrium aggregatum]|uniref:uncharacterized protein n=1 Tax=Polychytrium aggregatum TaxID=110093 RepID=UPI0022FDC2F2|nr:uncharacterized protein BJ171DRAFT_513383 [Polychytrium aggregatum]KAI9202544.1 hypothetical protein BJ171DRAFT_513383 [Polychytrium aggregatum]